LEPVEEHFENVPRILSLSKDQCFRRDAASSRQRRE